MLFSLFISILDYDHDDLPYNPRYATYQGSSTLPTIPEDGPPPPEDPVAFPQGPHKDASDSTSVTKESIITRTTCGKYLQKVISLIPNQINRFE